MNQHIKPGAKPSAILNTQIQVTVMPLATDHATSELDNIELQNISIGQLVEKIATGVAKAYTDGYISKNTFDEINSIILNTSQKNDTAYGVFLQGLDEVASGGLTQATCEAGLAAYKAFHESARKLDRIIILTVNVLAPDLPDNAKKNSERLTEILCARGWMIHNRIEDHLPAGMNEGDKC